MRQNSYSNPTVLCSGPCHQTHLLDTVRKYEKNRSWHYLCRSCETSAKHVECIQCGELKPEIITTTIVAIDSTLASICPVCRDLLLELMNTRRIDQTLAPDGDPLTPCLDCGEIFAESKMTWTRDHYEELAYRCNKCQDIVRREWERENASERAAEEAMERAVGGYSFVIGGRAYSNDW